MVESKNNNTLVSVTAFGLINRYYIVKINYLITRATHCWALVPCQTGSWR